MKKLILIAVLAMAMSGCNQDPLPIDNVGNTMDKGGYRLQVIDGCEYIQFDRSLTHKGNCKNPIHIYKDTVDYGQNYHGGAANIKSPIYEKK